MGQGGDEPPKDDSMYKANTRNGRQANSSVGDVQIGNGNGNGNGTESEKGMSDKGSTLGGGGGGSTNQEKRTRERSSTMAGGEGHDHEEGFPASEKKQMEECLEEILGTLGECEGATRARHER